MTWNLTMDDWIVMSRCNRVAKQLFSRNKRDADEFARLAYQNWIIDGIYPEELRDRRAPSLSDKARLRKRKQLMAGGFYAGAL
jgi:hypothetical protein